MEFLCDSKYLIFPASHDAKVRRLCFYIDNILVLDLDIALDYVHPAYFFPLHLERFMGSIIRVTCEPDGDIQIEKAQTADFAYDGLYRPLSHFTARRGWLNDPNGLVYHDGRYLMFYQHNPVGCVWGNMHWGAAVSNDLIHWQEGEESLFPDETGTMFSGCGIVDHKNVTGLKENDHDVILFFYTAAGGTSKTSKEALFTQNLAYSVDGGKTLIKYKHNPVVAHISAENRDPKVIYYEPEDSYIMALYLDGHDFLLLRSKNLLDWSKLQKITLPDDAECPDFYPLAADGNKSNLKWILSAASDRYYIGSFDGTHFFVETAQKRLHYGNASYAAQSWQNTPDGRSIRTAFANCAVSGMPFANCMNIPQEMSLQTINGDLFLCAAPVREIETLYLQTDSFHNIAVDNKRSFSHKTKSKCCDISLTVTCGAPLTISLFGLSISYDSEKKILTCLTSEAVIKETSKELRLRIVIDTIYAEIFADRGSIFMGIAYVQDSSRNQLVISSENAFVKSLSVSEMKEFWQEKI